MEQRQTVLDLDFASISAAQVFEEIRKESAGQPLPSRSLEDGENNDWIRTQEYSNCDRPQRLVAGLLAPLMLNETVTIDDLSLEVRAAIVSVHQRRKTSVLEAIQTHPELRAHINVNYEQLHLIREGHIMWTDGTTKMSSGLVRGEEKAKQEAATNPLMVPIARRTGADLRFGERAEQLEVGQFLIGPSAYEDSADELFMRGIGWHKGLSFWQAACRISEDLIWLSSYSVDPVPSEVIRRVSGRKIGHTIPPDLKADTWQDYSGVFEGDMETCRQMLRELRADCYQETDDTRERFTIEDIFEMNKKAGEQIFNKLFMRVVLRVKDEVIQTFIKGLLDKPDDLNEDVYWSLLGMYNKDHMTDSDGNLLEHLIRYAEAQHYCRALRAAIRSGSLAALQTVTVPTFNTKDQAGLLAMANQLSGHVIYGAGKKEILGGCIKLVMVGRGKRKDKDGDSTLSDLAEALGIDVSSESSGAEEGSEKDSTTGKIRCIKCRQYVRKAEVVKKDCWKCPRCNHEVDVCTGKTLREGSVSDEVDDSNQNSERVEWTILEEPLAAKKKSQYVKAA